MDTYGSRDGRNRICIEQHLRHLADETDIAGVPLALRKVSNPTKGQGDASSQCRGHAVSLAMRGHRREHAKAVVGTDEALFSPFAPLALSRPRSALGPSEDVASTRLLRVVVRVCHPYRCSPFVRMVKLRSIALVANVELLNSKAKLRTSSDGFPKGDEGGRARDFDGLPKRRVGLLRKGSRESKRASGRDVHARHSRAT